MAESSNQGQTQRQGRKLKPRSDVWKHFTRVKVTGDDGTEEEKAKCNRCGILYAIHGTTNQRKHIKKCVGQESADVDTARPAAQPPPLPPPPCAPPPPSRPGLSSDCREPEPVEEAKKHLARMIALHGYDPSVVEDDYFRSFVRRLNRGFEVPSRKAIEEMCDGIFDEARTDLLSRVRSAPGRLCFAVGKAKTITMEAGEAMYIACHFIDDQWKLHKVVMDAFVPEDDRHDYMDGPILGVNFVDDADELASEVISQHENRLSLVAYGITDDDTHTELKDYIETINSDRNLSCTATTYVDNVLHSVARCLDPPAEFKCYMCMDMESLHLTRQERLQLLSELGLDYKWAYDEHWCACYYSLQVVRERRFTNHIAGAELFVELLCKVWGQVYSGIQRISASTFPTSNLCLAELLKLREILHSELARFSGDDPDLEDRYEYFEGDRAAKVVLREASDKLDKAIQDSYLVWSVPLALDPRYKVSCIEFSFKRAFGSDAGKYISEVRTKINKLYADYIIEYGTMTAADHSDGANTTMAHPWDQAWNEHRRSQDTMAAQVNSSCLHRYVQDPLAQETDEADFDVLNWWKKNCQKYPIVARMARDALAMPTCSKLSSEQMAHVRSILRGYSKASFELP